MRFRRENANEISPGVPTRREESFMSVINNKEFTRSAEKNLPLHLHLIHQLTFSEIIFAVVPRALNKSLESAGMDLM
jgi:hypothetical protein